jgi:hypothetical protein
MKRILKYTLKLIDEQTIDAGHPVPDANRLDYIGTFQLHEGALVFHVFEKL